MPELVCPALHTLLPELILSLKTSYENVECEMQPCPDLEKSPFNLAVSYLGQLVYIVPNSITAVEACRQIVGGKLISTTKNFHIVTDEKSSFVLKIQLQHPKEPPSDWTHNLRQFFDKKLQADKWELVCVAVDRHSQASIYLIKDWTSNREESHTSDLLPVTLWLTCVNRRIVAGTTKTMHSSSGSTPSTNGSVELEKPKKKKIIKKLVVRNPGATKESAAVEAKVEENGTACPAVQPGLTPTTVNGVKAVQKAVDQDSPKKSSPLREGPEINGTHKPNGLCKKTEVNGVGGIQPPVVNTENKILQRVNSEPNKQKNGGMVGKMAAMFNGRSQSQENEGAQSVPLSSSPKQSKSDQSSDTSSGFPLISELHSYSKQDLEPSQPTAIQPPNSEELVSDEDSNLSYFSTLNSTSFHINDNEGEETCSSAAVPLNSISDAEVQNGGLKGPISRRPFSLTPPTCSTPARLLNGHQLSGRVLSPISSASSIPEPEEDETLYQVLQDDCSQRPSVDRDDSEMLDLSFRDDYSYCSNTTEMFDRTFLRKKEANNNSSRMLPEVVVNGHKCSRNLEEGQRQVSPIKEKQLVRGTEMPVIVLQHALNRLTFHELSELRRVHPHWDELCGQMLNSAYYQLIQLADRLLTKCQRRMHKEKHLVQCGQIMTKIQVHVLNPVDVLRAAMDEGVLCFPYGRLLDKTFDLLGRVEKVIQGIDDPDTILNWERLAELSRRAQVHYRQFVEPEAEKRMAEVCKLSAVHRLQRLDSFLVEASVNKLGKVAEKAKDDVQFEIEQLKSANQQLKKDNRELKQSCLKLDARIEVLERKFKTMARLLQ